MVVIMKDFDIPNTGAIFTFGLSRFADNSPSYFFIKNDPVVEFSCGDQHTAVVCKTGRVFTFGNNDWGQLGLGHKEPVTRPSCVKSLKPEKVKHVACGRTHTIFATESKKIYSCGCNTDGQLGIGDNKTLEFVALPMFVTELEGDIIQISAGSLHTLILTDKGSVYVWGSNAEGQLGLPYNELNIYSDPVLLNLPNKIVFIDCGYYHTGLITKSGKLMLCGNCENGKLGFEGNDLKVQFGLIQASISDKIISVSCGGHHTIALTDEGKCLICGENSHGQIGIPQISLAAAWMTIKPFEYDFIIAISAGENNSMFLTDKNVLYACGDKRHGKLGLNTPSKSAGSIFTPTEVKLSVGKMKITGMKCGGCHTMVMAIPIATSPLKRVRGPIIEKEQFLETTIETDNINENSQTSSKIHSEILPLINEQSNENQINVHDSSSHNSTEELHSCQENTTSLTSEETETPKINNEKINEIETNDDIETESTLCIENRDTEKNGKTSLSSNITSNEGKFIKILRQIGIKKIIESKSETNTSASYRSSLEKKKPPSSKKKITRVKSKVCTLF